MSLLNDMLRDLQQQKHYQIPVADGIATNNASAPVSPDHRLLQQSSIVKKTPVLWLPSLLVFIVVLVGLLLAKQYFFSAPIPATHPAPATDTQAVTLEQEKISTVTVPESLSIHTSTEAVNYDVAPQEIPTTSVAEAPAIAEIQQLKIYDLLHEAARALTLERLTTPVEDNAHYYYQQILLIDPNNPAALQGLNKIVGLYLAMADAKLAVLDIDRAEQLIGLAETVRPDTPMLSIYREKIAQARTDAPVLMDTENIGVHSVSDAGEATGDSLVENVNEPSSESSVSIQEPFAQSAEPQHLSIAPNARWQDKKSVTGARLMLEQDNVSGAINLLKNAIASNSKPSASTKMLLDIYSEQQLIDEAEVLLADADYLEPTERAYYGAKVALLKNQQAEAIALLEAQHAGAEEYEQYRALLASLYQGAARYHEAASHYRRLITAFGNKPAYWLGFALALDALEQKSSALQAYQRLTEFRNLQSEVRTYADQRISELTPSRVVSE